MISSETDLLKYKALAAGDILPNGKYKIKTRGALGTTKAVHNSSSDSIIQQWTTGGTEFTYSATLEGSKNSKVIAKGTTNDSISLNTIDVQLLA